MKFVKEVTPKGLLLPVTATRLARFGVGERVEYHSLENAMVVLKGQMTAMELLTAAQSLQNLAVELCTHLAEVCGSCGGCEDCENICPYTDLDDEEIGLPNYLRQEAGIPEDAKLCAEVDEENHYYKGCMHQRNRVLVNNSSTCICYLTQTEGGTAYTVNYARNSGLSVFNLAKIKKT